MILFSGGNIVYCYRDAKNAASSDNWDLNAYESVERLGGYSVLYSARKFCLGSSQAGRQSNAICVKT